MVRQCVSWSSNAILSVLSDDDHKQKTWYSIFPIDNYDLMYGDWEKDIIIDPEVRCIFISPRSLQRTVPF